MAVLPFLAYIVFYNTSGGYYKVLGETLHFYTAAEISRASFELKYFPEKGAPPFTSFHKTILYAPSAHMESVCQKHVFAQYLP